MRCSALTTSSTTAALFTSTLLDITVCVEMPHVCPSVCTTRQPVPKSFAVPPVAFLNSTFARLQLFTHQSSRSIEFWRRTLAIWLSFKLTQANIAVQRRYRSPSWPRDVWHRQHSKAGKMMLQLCTEMKGFYVKAGQIIALQAFVPKVIRDTLRVLQDNMPPMDAPTTVQVIEHELHQLGLSMDVFESLDVHNVLGSASVAQVHRGRLRDGSVDVAVKIQFPNVERLMMADLANFRVLGEILQRTELKFDLVQPVQELSRQLAMEFDFRHEARNMAEIRYALRRVKQVSVPEAIPGLVSRRLLVMTFLDGIPLSKLDGALEKRGRRTVRLVGRRIMKNLTACYGKMILTDGFFQADCHPGNIIVRNDKVDIGLLDFGQTKRFSNETRLAFVKLVDAMARKDTPGVAAGLEQLGIRIGHTAAMEKRKGHAKHSLTLEEKMAYTMFDTASVPGVNDNPFGEGSTMKEGSIDELPKELFFLLRTMQILKGLCHATFNSDFSIISSWRHIARTELNRPSWRALLLN
eukprot:TRINITY_DN293_c0_g1_i1.p1 TRINITY_DN293_c0_g1~~TRINITY_DN293_c0_g1_i1.p1  ORF type:complete len:522 (+),score=99.59 TRINITY_DN293_c0_g1_i1:3506-5071(+)